MFSEDKAQAQARARRVPSMPMPQQPGQPFDPMYQGVPMGVNKFASNYRISCLLHTSAFYFVCIFTSSIRQTCQTYRYHLLVSEYFGAIFQFVPGQTQPLMRYPQGTMTSPSYPLPTAAGPRPNNMMTSPGYPQMYRAGAPVLYGQVQQHAQHQQVVSYPNPNVPPDERYNVPYPQDSSPPVILSKEVIMRPFGLEHNMNHHTFTFNLRTEIIQQLQSPFIDIQLKSFHKDDKKIATQWPPKQTPNGHSVPGAHPECSIQVLINGQMVPIPDLSRSLFIKQVVVHGPNTIEFNVNQCVCSHSFIMQLVVRQPLSKVTQDIFTRTQNCTAETCRDKLLKLAPPTGLRVPLVCDITHRRMSIPARSSRCAHAACFDLEPFIIQQNENSLYECHICRQLNEIELDYFVGKMLRESTGNQVVEMLLETNGEYRPVEPELAGRKRSGDENGSTHPIKRIKSEPFPQPVVSPFPPPPGSAPMANASAVSSMMSPFAASQSPSKAVSSPSGARFNCGPGTPSTPHPPQNPASVGTLPNPSQPEPIHSGTSPHQTQIQQHGSVEAPSLTGSAPYTPASVNSGVALPAVNPSDHPFGNINNLSMTSLDIEIDGKSLFGSTLMTADDIKKYLNDSDTIFTAFDDLTCTNDPPPISGFPHCWEDIQSIIAADEKRG
uniref:SP-RING-type domain-containing protein n=1 Tax=Angiostrongylus cantonensis TaxID=6313 RepID=A0A158PC86_ANGCA